MRFGKLNISSGGRSVAAYRHGGLPTRIMSRPARTRIVPIRQSGPFFLDTFRSQAGTPLEEHAPDVGVEWTPIDGENVGVWPDGAGSPGGDDPSGYYAATATAPAEYAVRADLYAPNGNLTSLIASFLLAARVVSPIDGYYVVYRGGGWSLRTIASGALASVVAPSPTGERVTVELQVGTGTQRLLVDGVEVLTATDAALSGGVPGFELATTGLYVERFEATSLTAAQRPTHPARIHTRPASTRIHTRPAKTRIVVAHGG